MWTTENMDSSVLIPQPQAPKCWIKLSDTCISWVIFGLVLLVCLKIGDQRKLQFGIENPFPKPWVTLCPYPQFEGRGGLGNAATVHRIIKKYRHSLVLITSKHLTQEFTDYVLTNICCMSMLSGWHSVNYCWAMGCSNSLKCINFWKVELQREGKREGRREGRERERKMEERRECRERGTLHMPIIATFGLGWSQEPQTAPRSLPWMTPCTNR